MAWTYANLRIYVQDDAQNTSQIIPRLQPISAGTVLQKYGYETEIRSLKALVVGYEKAEHIKTLVASGVAFLLETPYGSGWYLPKKIAVSQISTICQTIEPALGDDAPVYNLDMELHLET